MKQSGEPQEFVAKWRKTSLSECQAVQEHFLDICHLVGHGTPAELDPAGTFFVFEAGVRKISGGAGRPSFASNCNGDRPAGNGYRLGDRVTIQDQFGAAVAGATVTLAITLPTGGQRTATATTTTAGQATVSFVAPYTGTYTFTVTAVSKPG